MQDIEMSSAGVNKPFSDLNVSKTAGSDAIRRIVLKQLSPEISSVVVSGRRHKSALFFFKGKQIRPYKGSCVK